jgi:hypothetical protein
MGRRRRDRPDPPDALTRRRLPVQPAGGSNLARSRKASFPIHRAVRSRDPASRCASSTVGVQRQLVRKRGGRAGLRPDSGPVQAPAGSDRFEPRRVVSTRIQLPPEGLDWLSVHDPRHEPMRRVGQERATHQTRGSGARRMPPARDGDCNPSCRPPLNSPLTRTGEIFTAKLEANCRYKGKSRGLLTFAVGELSRLLTSLSGRGTKHRPFAVVHILER